MLELLEHVMSGPDIPKRVAMLGVTPELVQMDWPEGTEICAFDHTAQMLNTVWKPHPTLASSATLARWQALPVPDGQFDFVVGDGSLNVLPTLDEYGPLFGELARVTFARAALVIRCFVRPDRPETFAHLKTEVAAGRVGSFHALKLRIAMLLSDERDGQVEVRAVYQAFECHFNREELAQQMGWPLAVIATIDVYQEVSTVYTYPTVAQLRERCLPHWLVDCVAVGRYELAERCPTLRLVRAPVAKPFSN